MSSRAKEETMARVDDGNTSCSDGARATRSLAFEIGTEEIPAFDLKAATDQLTKLVPAALNEAGISFGEVSILSSPRRLIVIVAELAELIPAAHEEFRGPKASIAFDEAGTPTKAACGFARSRGVAVEDLVVREHKGEAHVFALIDTPAKPVVELLPSLLVRFITELSWPRSCRWGTTRESFSRPVRWLCALFGNEVIPVRFADLVGDRYTWGHRVLAPGAHELGSADELLDVVRKCGVLPSMEERRAKILADIAAIEAASGFRASLPEKTLLEVINLTEYPTALMGEFDEAFLEVPEEIIVDAMLVHQRYFPLRDARGSLTNHFILVSNGDPACSSTIIDGNERVVRARLDDAKFFYEEDKKHPLEWYVDRLEDVIFQEDLGTVRDKAYRLVRLASHLARQAKLTAQDTQDLERACLLAKADLVTNAVIEFTSVQGIMGSYYALASGERAEVAEAIGQHYRPRFAGDAMPGSEVGRLTAFADKLDTICGLFGVGHGPTGTKDPFALRRSAIGIVRMLEAGLPVRLAPSVEEAIGGFEHLTLDRELVSAEVLDFFVTRTRVILRDDGYAPDTIEAIVAAGIKEPAEIIARVKALSTVRRTMPEVMDDLATAYKRAHNLRDPSLGDEVDLSLLSDAEASLLDAILAAERELPAALDLGKREQAFKELAALRQPIDRFFEDVLIMDEDLALRRNRLRLLNRFVGLFATVADFGKLESRVR